MTLRPSLQVLRHGRAADSDDDDRGDEPPDARAAHGHPGGARGAHAFLVEVRGRALSVCLGDGTSLRSSSVRRARDAHASARGRAARRRVGRKAAGGGRARRARRASGRRAAAGRRRRRPRVLSPMGPGFVGPRAGARAARRPAPARAATPPAASPAGGSPSTSAGAARARAPFARGAAAGRAWPTGRRRPARRRPSRRRAAAGAGPSSTWVVGMLGRDRVPARARGRRARRARAAARARRPGDTNAAALAAGRRAMPPPPPPAAAGGGTRAGRRRADGDGPDAGDAAGAIAAEAADAAARTEQPRLHQRERGLYVRGPSSTRNACCGAVRQALARSRRQCRRRPFTWDGNSAGVRDRRLVSTSRAAGDACCAREAGSTRSFCRGSRRGRAARGPCGCRATARAVARDVCDDARVRGPRSRG